MLKLVKVEISCAAVDVVDTFLTTVAIMWQAEILLRGSYMLN